MNSIQFKKGVLELCVMTLLGHRDYYGYELVETISASIQISEGTIYPLLKRLKDEGYVTTYLTESEAGAPRKYYKLTSKGEESRTSSVAEWQEFANTVNKFLNDNA